MGRGFFTITHKIKHVLYRYFPENQRLGRGSSYTLVNMVSLQLLSFARGWWLHVWNICCAVQYKQT